MDELARLGIVVTLLTVLLQMRLMPGGKHDSFGHGKTMRKIWSRLDVKFTENLLKF